MIEVYNNKEDMAYYMTNNTLNLKNFVPRLYQQTVLATASAKNTLVVLPTGMGKTSIALMLASLRLKAYPNSKILFLAPTKPLVEQHKESFKKYLDIDEGQMEVFTGFIKPEKRQELWNNKKIIFSTPQTIENDLLGNRINLNDVSLLVLDECVTKGTLIHLANGEKVKIEELDKRMKNEEIFIESLNEKTGNFEPSKIVKFHKIKSKKKLISIQCDNNIIKTTSDHLFFSKINGKIDWVPAFKLKANAQIALVEYTNTPSKKKILVNENDILKQYSQKQQRFFQQFLKVSELRKEKGLGARKISKITGIKEHTIRNWVNKPYQKPHSWKVIKELKKKKLLPFYSDNPYIPIISRLFGHLYGDGWATRNNKGNLILGFSGRQEDLKIIQNDLFLFGAKYSKIYSRKTISEINSFSGIKKVEGISNSFVVSDKMLTKLFYALDIPIGDKTKEVFLIPGWIMKGSLRIKKEFLSALMGSEGYISNLKKNSKTCNPIRISFNFFRELEKEGLQYIKQIKRLFFDFNIKSSISKKEGNIRKDGRDTIKILLTISNSNKDTKQFLEKINYTYSIKKRIQANGILTYLIEKENNLKERKALYQKAQELHKQGLGSYKIAKKLNLNKGLIENWIYYNKEPVMISCGMDKFDSEKHQIKDNKFSIVWRKIDKKEKSKNEDYVYDLTIEKNHNYIANNVLVHNCHHATGDYAYCFIAKQYYQKAKYPRILGLTASPGSDNEKIIEVCNNIHVEDIEVKTEEDPDVKPYIQEVDMEWVSLEFPNELKQIHTYLTNCYKSKLNEVKINGHINSLQIGKVELIKLQAQLHSEISHGNKDFEILKSVSLIAEAMKVQHAIELIETQGVSPLNAYLQRLTEESKNTKVKAVKNLVKDENFKSALIKVDSALGKVEHPKINKLKEILKKEVKENVKIIVFNQYRDTASKLESELTEEGYKAKVFVGQTKKGTTGLSQKKQKEILDEFRNNEFNILIATSVGEEGLDIPKVDLVIFYEPIPSAIRFIQRKGRTGRLEKGRVIILTTKNTRDEGYRWSAYHKQKRMFRNLKEIKKQFQKLGIKQEETLQKYISPEKELVVLVDDREKSSGIAKELIDMGLNITMRRLEIGDYILSPRCVVEYKTVKDFVDSIIDGRLLDQINQMKKKYDRPIIIIEGDEDLYSQRKIHPNAIRGMLATITVSLNIPIIQTKTFKETASLLAIIAKREQEHMKDGFTFHNKKPLTLKERQEYIVSSLPGVGPILAKPLLQKFKSIKNIVNADLEDLKKIEKIGEKKAKEIQKVLTDEYN